jgi:hypothetical protein
LLFSATLARRFSIFCAFSSFSDEAQRRFYYNKIEVFQTSFSTFLFCCSGNSQVVPPKNSKQWAKIGDECGMERGLTVSGKLLEGKRSTLVE